MRKGTEHDETAASYFKSGWDAAIREVALQRAHNRLDEFMQEQRGALGGATPPAEVAR